MPAPVKIEPPRVCIDLHSNGMVCTGLQDYVDIDLIAGTPKQLPPRHVAQDGRERVGNRAPDARSLGLRV
jgi:hypothetical protein